MQGATEKLWHDLGFQIARQQGLNRNGEATVLDFLVSSPLSGSGIVATGEVNLERLTAV